MISTIRSKQDPKKIESYHGRAAHWGWRGTDIIVVAESDTILNAIHRALDLAGKPNPQKRKNVVVTPYEEEKKND